jgi:hypothetical protein
MGLKQMANYYSLLQNQVRFAGDRPERRELGHPQVGRDDHDAFPDILDSDVWCVDPLRTCSGSRATSPSRRG